VFLDKGLRLFFVEKQMIMRIFKTSLFALFTTVLFLSACSKSSSDETTPEKEADKVTNKVMQTLIENFKGSATVTTQNEDKDVIFGIKFTSEKDGKITKLRRSTGSSDKAAVKLWYNENNSWKAYKEQEIVATAAGDVYSGDTAVEGWNIKKGVEYHIAIRLYKRTLEVNSNRVRRLVGTNNIENGIATVGPITFKKEFYWATHSTSGTEQATKYPNNLGSNTHFAGFLDFDFEVTD